MTWYIVDGMDGSGKSSAAEALKDMLESDGRRVFIVTHPDQGCWFGRAEARFLRIPGKPSEIIATVLYIMDAVQSVMGMRTSRGRYDDFIFVRYIMAVAYLPDDVYGKAYDIIERILPMPDVRIMVDVDADVAFDRIESRGEDKEIFETREKLRKTREKMISLASGWYIIDNNGSLEDTMEQIRRVKDRVERGELTPGANCDA